MNEKPCRKCGKPVPQTEGKKSKQYCSAKCRQDQWQIDQREFRKKAKQAGITLAKLVVSSAVAEKRDLSQLKGIASPELLNEAIWAEIKTLEAEKVPAHIQSEQMRVIWQQGQRKKINELKNKLKNM